MKKCNKFNNFFFAMTLAMLRKHLPNAIVDDIFSKHFRTFDLYLFGDEFQQAIHEFVSLSKQEKEDFIWHLCTRFVKKNMPDQLAQCLKLTSLPTSQGLILAQMAIAQEEINLLTVLMEHFAKKLSSDESAVIYKAAAKQNRADMLRFCYAAWQLPVNHILKASILEHAVSDKILSEITKWQF